MNMNQFDFEDEEIDEKTIIHALPMSIPQSLRNSRFYGDNCNQQDYTLIYNIHQNKNLNQYYQTQYININENTNTNENKQNKHIENKTKQKTNINTNINFNKFLQNQKAYQKKVENKIKRLREQKQNKKPIQTFKPQINKKSKQYIKTKIQSVFDRLYVKKQDQKQKNIINTQTFIPKISQKSKKMLRLQPVQQILYKDARLRQQKNYNSKNKNKNKQQQQSPHKHKHKHNQIPIKINLTNQKLIGKKFLQQYIQILQHLNLKQQKITKQNFIQILFYLGFISKQSTNWQLNKINQLYIEFSKYIPNYINFFNFLLALIGIYHFNPFDYVNIKIDNNNKISNMQEIIKINQNQAKNLHNKFNILYRNRLYLQQKGQIKNNQNICTFKPIISIQSEYLAQKHRKQVLFQASKYNKQFEKCMLSHPDYLQLKKYMQQYQIQQQRQQQQQKNMKQCTFIPKISKFQLKNKQKSFINFNNPQQKPIQNKIQTNHHQQQKQQQNDDKISQNSLSNYNINENNMKNIQQQQKNTNKSISTISNQMLILQINFNDNDEQIILKKQDYYRLNQIIKLYVDKYSMNQQSQKQLRNMLKIQLEEMFGF